MKYLTKPIDEMQAQLSTMLLITNCKCPVFAGNVISVLTGIIRHSRYNYKAAIAFKYYIYAR
jgi:hypothetical protein